MKKKFIALGLLALLTGCDRGVSTSTSTSASTSVSTPISTSTSTSISVSTPTSASTSSTSISTSTSTSISTPTEDVKEVNISQIITLGEKLENNQIGETVHFAATYLKAITMSRSNEDLMLFGDANSYIYLRLPYAKYSGYLSNLYTFKEYDVTANVTKVNDKVELCLNDSYTQRESVVFKSDTTTFDLDNVSETKNSLAELVADFEAIPLNKKNYGSGKIVTFEAQLIATEYEDANKKAVFYDGTNTVTVINNKKIVDKYDVGKHFKVSGVLNLEISSPAVLLLDINETSASTPITIENAEVVTPSFCKKWNLTSNKMNPPSISDYLKVYQTTGYVKTDDDRQSAYYIGVVDTATGTLSDNGITTSIPGFFLMNHLNIDERSFSYSPFYGFFDQPEPVTFYFTLHNFDTSNHAWKCFPLIEYVTMPNPDEPNLEITVAQLIK